MKRGGYMTPEIQKLCEDYNITIKDMNVIHQFCIANQKDEAIKYIQPIVEYNRQIAEMIVDNYIHENINHINEHQTIIQNYQTQKQSRDFLNKPKCPTCNSTNLKKISTTSKVVNTAVFGLFGTKRFKQFHCNNCGYEW